MWASLAGAQEVVDETAAEEEPLRRYTVEIIVFSYAEDAYVGSEIFLPDEPPPAEELEEEIPEFGDAIAVSDEPVVEEDVEEPPSWIIVPEYPVEPVGDEEPNPFQLVLLTEEEHLLSDVVERFELLDAYETVAHFGWTQPTFPEEETPPIELQLLAEAPEGLAGTLTLYLSRYLHLVVDLTLDAPDEFSAEVVEEESFFSFGDSRPTFGDPVEELVMPVRFRIQEDRIVKNGELRYFDHPRFGVLAKVSRIEEPEEETDDAGVLTGGRIQ